MREDFYVDESVMISNANKLFAMSNYYVATLERYIAIMTAVNTESINDSNISGEIAEIITQTRNYENDLLKLGEDIRNSIAAEVSAVEDNSTYTFPEEPDLGSIFA